MTKDKTDALSIILTDVLATLALSPSATEQQVRLMQRAAEEMPHEIRWRLEATADLVGSPMTPTSQPEERESAANQERMADQAKGRIKEILDLLSAPTAML